MGIQFRKLACLAMCDACGEHFIVVLTHNSLNECRYYAECPQCHQLQELMDMPRRRLSNAKSVCNDVQPYNPQQHVEDSYQKRLHDHYREQLALATAHLHNLETAAERVIRGWKKHWNQDVLWEPMQQLRLRLRDIRLEPLSFPKKAP